MSNFVEWSNFVQVRRGKLDPEDLSKKTVFFNAPKMVRIRRKNCPNFYALEKNIVIFM